MDITGKFATEAYLPEPFVGLVSLRRELADFSRLDTGAVPYLDSHVRTLILGKVREAHWDDGENAFRFRAWVPDAPEDPAEDVPRVANFRREFKLGLRGLNSVGFRITGLRYLGTNERGDPLYDAEWTLTEISDVSVPTDPEAYDDPDTGERMLPVVGTGNLGWIAETTLTRALAGGPAMPPDNNDPTTTTVIEGTRSEPAPPPADPDADRVRSIVEATVAEYLSQGERMSLRMDEAVTAALTRLGVPGQRAEDEKPEDDERMPEDEKPEDGEREGDHPEDGERGDGQRQEPLTPLELEGVRSLLGAGDGSQRAIPPGLNIHPTGRPHDVDNMRLLDLGHYVRALVAPSAIGLQAKRELDWMQRNLGQGLNFSPDGGQFIPFSVLAESSGSARDRRARLAERGLREEEYLEGFARQAEIVFERHLRPNWVHGDAERALTLGSNPRTGNTSTGATVSTIVDLARAIMWLTEGDAALSMVTVVPGLTGEWASFYGNSPPVEDWVAEASGNAQTDNAITVTNPTFTRLNKLPKTMGMYWTITTTMLAAADIPIAARVEGGCRAVASTKFMRAVFSGTGVLANFAADANAIAGLMNAGITQISAGANAAAIDRDDTIDARRALFGDEVQMTNLGWVLSNDAAKALEKKRIGGSESVRFVYENGMVDCGAQKIPAAETVHLGKASTFNPAVLLQKDAALALIWGGGFPLNALQLPGKTEVGFDIQLHSNFAMMNPKRARILTTVAA